jgi:hypothetical protein
MHCVRLESLNEFDTRIDALISMVAIIILNETWGSWERLPPRWVNRHQSGMNILPQPIMVQIQCNAFRSPTLQAGDDLSDSQPVVDTHVQPVDPDL